jgi:putative radical SAM enzyme (TIGR03279 family)
MKNNGIIKLVHKGSIGEELGLKPGDEIVSINGKKLIDIIDYLFLVSDEELEIHIKKHDGEEIIYELEKEYDEDLGVEFSNPLMDEAKRCSNNCIFCFIDQMPKGMRESLYFKDDDSRLSFIQGNFVTLTNVTYNQLDRIIRYKISPINVSIHSTDPEVRIKMLKNNKSGDIYKKLKLLHEGQINMNGQIVLLRDINDEKNLEKTILDLSELYPSMNSIAVVPVGITKYREGLETLKTFDKQSSRRVIEQIEYLQELMIKKLGTRFVFAADEFYVMADIEVPNEEYYEGYIQIENGVGLLRKFENELLKTLKPYKHKNKYSGIIVTGNSAFKYMVKWIKEIQKNHLGMELEVINVENNFFGNKITVSGLITGKDLIENVKGKKSDFILIPKVMLKQDEDIFLDDYSLEMVEQELGIKVIPIDVDGTKLINYIKEHE